MMRRNIPGGNRGGPSWQPSPRSSGGPLMTDLGLQDIDKELELLQRKREIIEQQQQILSNGFRERNSYEDSYSHGSRFDSYAPSFSDRRDYTPAGRKRPIPVWEDELPSKRFSGPTRPRHERPAPPPLMRAPPFQLRPLSAPIKPKPQKRDPPKVIKPAPMPNKVKSCPAERKKATASAIDLTAEGSEENRLRADREPSKQLNGRLELALGSIIKEMKAKTEPHVVKSATLMREIKMTVRDRIRELMMDRLVGSSERIVARYREVYDQQSDLEVVANAVESQTGQIILFKTDDPEKYFKINMHRIMHMRLKHLLKKVEAISHAENEIEGAESEPIPFKNLVKDLPEAEMKPLDENIISKDKYKLLEKLMTAKMSALVKKFIPYIVKLMDIDTKYVRLKNAITTDTVKILMQKEGADAGGLDSSDVSMQSINALLDKPFTPTMRYTPYYAKLMGKPGLPKRNQMQHFFEQFKPKSIKKHRTVHNLLFICFHEKDSFDRFLAADGTTIGKYVLSIKVSERSTGDQEKGAKKELDSSTASEDKLLGSELDEQITDLLTSIREENEGNNMDTVETGNTAEGIDNNTLDVDEKNAEIADKIIAEDANAKVNEEDTDANIAENADEDTEESADNVGENAVVNVENAEANVENTLDVDEKNAEIADKIIAEDANAKVNEEDTDANIAENADADTEESADNVGENAVVNVENADAIIEGNENNTEYDNDNITDSNVANKAEKQDAKNTVTPDNADENCLSAEKSSNGEETDKELKEEKASVEAESADKVQPLDTKPLGRSTPVRTSSRLAATPSRIQTRRASRLAQSDP